MIDVKKLSIGIIFPIEGYAGGIPEMKNQEALAQQCERAGFHTLWVRDVPLYDPNFGDAGQMFDPWVYLTHIAAKTQHIKLGTSSAILPLRKPINMAKSAASIDVLYPNRLHLGVASGDRPLEYPAYNVDFQNRDVIFRDSFETIKTVWKDSFPKFNNVNGKLDGAADVLPKPVNHSIPMYITGHAAGQTLDWIATNGDGWMFYPRNLMMTQGLVQDWERALDKNKQTRKPYLQSLYIDIVEDADAPPMPIHLGFRLGRNYLLEILKQLEIIGVNHVILVTKFASRPLDEIIDELGEFVIPNFQ